VNTLDHRLARVEELRLRPLDLTHETVGQILHHDSIRASEESDDVLDEVALAVSQFLPVSHVLAEVNLLSHPNDGHVLLVTIPDVLVADREDREAILCCIEQRFGERRKRKRSNRNRSLGGQDRSRGSIQCKRRGLLL